MVMSSGLVSLVLALCCVQHVTASQPSFNPTANPSTVFSGTCQSGWTTAADRCYLFESGDKTWQECKSFCTAKGGYLPCILGSYQTDIIRKVHPTTTELTWLGYNDIAGEGTFVWDSGCSNSFTQWQPGSPDNSGGNEDCAALVASNNQWGDISCSNSIGCSCEQEFSSTGNACPVGWTLSEDGTYCLSFEKNGGTYTTCESSCAAMSATMLCLRNAAEAAFFSKLRSSRQYTWLGYNRASGSYHWPPGCTSTYTNWGGSEPDNSGTEFYAFIYKGYNGGWGDISNDPGAPFDCVCQKPAFIRTASPSVSPSKVPTTVPTAPPSLSPTASPTSYLSAMMAAPPYQVKSGFAFAARGSDGSVHTWGEAGVGGDSSAVSSLLTSGVVKVVPSRAAFTALKSDGTIVPWGAVSSVRNANSVHPPLSSLVASEAAFAGIVVGTGAVYAFGAYQNGGNVIDDTKCNGYSTQLSSGVMSIVATMASFTALKTDGTVYTWGSKYCGGGVSSLTVPALVGVIMVVATSEAFAALLSTGSVITWGGLYAGGDSSAVSHQLASNVVHLTATKSVFVAFKSDTSLVVWGSTVAGGDTSNVAAALSANVKFVAHTFLAMAALKVDGSVVTWGDVNYGGDSSVAQSHLVDVITIEGNGYAFAALTSAGGVVVWGDAASGGEIPAEKMSALTSGVSSIYHTTRAFAALKSDGSVVVWGQAGHGGSPGAAVEALLTSGVHTICSNDAAFLAIKYDGSVVGWGHAVSVPVPGVQFTSTTFLENAICA